jgi:hypothetical protein
MSYPVKNACIEVRDGSVVYRGRDGRSAWSLPIRQIILVAEYTTDEGPYCDDYFIVFVSTEGGRAYFSTCSFYADGMAEVITLLGGQFGTEMELALANSTKWDSRVIWPPDLGGSKYFEFTEITPKNSGERIRKALLGKQLEYRITEPIRTFISMGGSMGL